MAGIDFSDLAIIYGGPVKFAAPTCLAKKLKNPF
jgi:hypothetical protein